MANIKTVNGNHIFVGSDGIEARAIKEAHLADKAVTGPKLADGSVTSAKVKDKAITTPKLADGAVTGRKLADETIQGSKIQRDSISDRQMSKASGQVLARVSALEDGAVPFPTQPLSKYGEPNQVLRTRGNGTTVWEYESIPPEEVIDESISSWLADHPEATTTVQDGSLTPDKFNASVSITDAEIDLITES